MKLRDQTLAFSEYVWESIAKQRLPYPPLENSSHLKGKQTTKTSTEVLLNSRRMLRSITDRAPNIGESPKNMRHHTPNPFQNRPRSQSYSKSLGVARLRVQLEVQNGNTANSGIDLFRGLDQKLVLFASAGGDDPEESILKVLYYLDWSIMRIKALGFVVGYEFLWSRKLPPLGSWRTHGGCSAVGLGERIWEWWWFPHWSSKLGREEGSSFDFWATG